MSRLRLSQQQVEAATRAKSEFVANMSHELRTPLNAITLYGELLEEGARADGRETDVADLTKLQSASRHLLGLINGILDLSKIEAGKMELDLQTFDLKTMIDELVGAIDALVQKNSNTLTVMPVTVMDHPERGLRPFPGLPRTSDTVEMLVAD